MTPQTSGRENTMAYAQWVSVNIQISGFTAILTNVIHEWGKFYADGDKDKEVPPSDIEGTSITTGNNYTINACGRSNAAAGTQGSFDIYDGTTLVGSYSWDCPWGSKTNTSTWTPHNENYVGQQTGANLDSGALGNVTLKVVKF